MERINKHGYIKEILVYLLFLLIFISIFIARPVNDLDELWNYNIARNIANGLNVYSEISIIVTPLSSFILAIFLKIVDELITMRISGAILCSSVFYMIYIILKKLTNKRAYAIIVTSLMIIFMYKSLSFDYNVFSLLIALIILYCEMKNNEQKEHIKVVSSNNIIIGILTGLMILTKQTTGIIMAIMVICYPLFWIRQKSDIKTCLKICLNRFIGILIPNIIFLLYLIITKSLSDFISYSILGIKTFSNRIPYKSLFEQDFYTRVLSILIPITIIILIVYSIKSIKERKDRNIVAITIYGLAMMVLIIPISDKVHFLIGSTIIAIGLFYGIIKIFNYLETKIFKRTKLIQLIKQIIVFFLALLLISVLLSEVYYCLYGYIINSDKIHNISHYKGIIISEDLKERIQTIDSYILEEQQKGKKVYILDAEAVVYKIPINQYDKNYDMFLIGNLGKDGQEGIIQEIEQKNEDIIYLIKKDNLRLNWQTPLKVINYVKDNLDKVDEISIYDVYEGG